MSGPWSVVLAVASVAFALRAAGPTLLGGREVPARLADVIELLPPALLAAFVATGVFVSRSALVLDARAERFAGLELRVEHGVPLLAGAAAQMVCAVQELQRCADHVLVVGAPVWQSVDTRRGPLLLHQGAHRRVAG